MSSELLLRVIGYLSLLAAISYLYYLFGPPIPGLDWSRVRGLFSSAGARAREAAQAAKVPKLPKLRTRPHSSPERGAAISLIEGYDEHHAERMARSARLLGRAAGLSGDDLETLVEAAYLHDTGEEGFAELLAKPRPLSVEEWMRLEEHPLLGEEIALRHAEYPDASWWVRWYHERYDGTGYPDGLAGDEIPLPARILAVVDTYEALTHARPYRQAWEPQDALTELRSLAGIHFDPRLVALFTDQVFPVLAAEDSRDE
ncbi:MAG TPA: HD domain-containing phosphohydrolase [Stenomitos sp.]